MRQSDRVRLHFGPYRTPRYNLGQRVQCTARGELTIVGTTDGLIPWPVGKRGRAKSLVLYKSLANAVRKESEQAICHWWKLSRSTVRKWRRLLGVPPSNPGSNRLYVAYARTPAAKAARQKAWIKARDPVRREKIAASKRGRKRPPAVVAKMRAANLGKTLDATTRRKLSQAHRRRGTRPPKAGPPWSAEEETLLRTLPASEVAKRTGRSLTAVYSRRSTLGVNDGRTSRHRQENAT